MPGFSRSRRDEGRVGLATGERRLGQAGQSCSRSAMQVNILEAKNQLSRLVKAAAAGREIVIASNGKPMAKLVPLAPRRRFGGWRAIALDQARIDAAFAPEVEGRVARSLRGKR